MDERAPDPCLRDEQLEAAAQRRSMDAATAAHLHACPRCRGAVDEIRENDAFLARIGSSLSFDGAARPQGAAGLPRGDEGHSRGGAECAPGSEPRPTRRESDLHAPGAPAASGALLSSCRLLDEVHRGGQGVVYKAVHTATGRRVAVKTLIDGALASEAHQRRFEREMEIVANLRHPSIVTLYETGVLPDGRLAFAMEWIQGVPIDQWARERADRSDARSARALVETKVRTFIRVCDAVQHAHQHGVIHRDLKPGNILVDAHDVPHVLDFGLAKIGSAVGGAHRVDPTMTGDFRGSLAYASPEQVGRHPELVDTRSDVYSLGVILYEVLTGVRICKQESSVAELVRAITVEEPPPPSSITRAVDDDLQTIVQRMLAKDPARRYQSAGAVRDDLERHLSGRPIDAKRDSAWYVIRKSIMRHRLTAAFVGALFVAAIAIALAFARAYASERGLAASQVTTAGALQMVIGLINPRNSATPWASAPSSKLALRQLDLVAEMLEELGVPELDEARVHHHLGVAYRTISMADASVHHLERAVMIRSKALGAHAPETRDSTRELASALLEARRRPEAEAVILALMPVVDAQSGGNPSESLAVAHLLASLRESQNRIPEALALSSACYDECRVKLGLTNELTLLSAKLTMNLLRRERRLEEAFAIGTRAVESLMELHGPDHPQTVDAKSALFAVLGTQKRFEEAERLMTEILAILRTHLGEDHPKTLDARHNEALLLLMRNQPQEAVERLRALVPIREKVEGETALGTLKSTWKLAELEAKLGDPRKAENLLVRIIATYDSNRLTDPQAEAVALVAMMDLGKLLGPARAADAERLLTRSVDGLVKRVGEADPDTQRSMKALADLYEATGRPELARSYRVKLTTTTETGPPSKP